MLLRKMLSRLSTLPTTPANISRSRILTPSIWSEPLFPLLQSDWNNHSGCSCETSSRTKARRLPPWLSPFLQFKNSSTRKTFPHLQRWSIWVLSSSKIHQFFFLCLGIPTLAKFPQYYKQSIWVLSSSKVHGGFTSRNSWVHGTWKPGLSGFDFQDWN